MAATVMAENRQWGWPKSARLAGVQLDHDHCYRAIESRDARFDGWFVTAVRTTGIYCRPSCPAITPKRANVEFFPAAATAQAHGYRACKRCRPDASPGSPEWNTRADVVGRAMRLIADGLVDRDGVPGLAGRLGYSERQVHRLLTAELGCGPLALARAQRAQTARILIETTTMPITDIAFAAGFQSVRQFNDTIRDVFAASPSHLRATRRPDREQHGAVTLRLAAREPFEAANLFGFLAVRAVPGVEHGDGASYRRSLRLPRGAGVISLTASNGQVTCALHLDDVADAQAAVQRARRLLDLDSDPRAVDAHLADDVGAAMPPQRHGSRTDRVGLRTHRSTLQPAQVDAPVTPRLRGVDGGIGAQHGARDRLPVLAEEVGQRERRVHERAPPVSTTCSSPLRRSSTVTVVRSTSRCTSTLGSGECASIHTL